MIRRTYYTEFIDYLIKENLATPDKKTHLNFLCGMQVDPLQEDFHSKIKSLLSKEINLAALDGSISKSRPNLMES